VPCYRCGVRQTDPERGKSPWRRGVVRDQLVLICPACQESTDWTPEHVTLVPARGTGGPDTSALADEVGRALDRLLGRS